MSRIGKPSERLRQFDCLNARVTSVALGSSFENIRTSDNLWVLFNHFEWTKNRILKIPAEFRIPCFPAYRWMNNDNVL